MKLFLSAPIMKQTLVSNFNLNIKYQIDWIIY